MKLRARKARPEERLVLNEKHKFCRNGEVLLGYFTIKFVNKFVEYSSRRLFVGCDPQTAQADDYIKYPLFVNKKELEENGLVIL